MRFTLLAFTFILGSYLGLAQPDAESDSIIMAKQNQRLQQANDSLTEVIEIYRDINQRYYELAKESRDVTTWIWSIAGIGGIVGLIIILLRVYDGVPKVARSEVAKLVKLNQRSFDGVIALYGAHFSYLKTKSIWVVEPHEMSDRENSIAYFLRELGFEKAESIKEEDFKKDDFRSQAEKPDMILLNNEGQEIQPKKSEETEDKSIDLTLVKFVERRNKLNAKAILFWYDINGIRFPSNIGRSNYCNSRYTLYNNIIESFRVQDIS